MTWRQETYFGRCLSVCSHKACDQDVTRLPILNLILGDKPRDFPGNGRCSAVHQRCLAAALSSRRMNDCGRRPGERKRQSRLKTAEVCVRSASVARLHTFTTNHHHAREQAAHRLSRDLTLLLAAGKSPYVPIVLP